jgi:hypothetical protein
MLPQAFPQRLSTFSMYLGSEECNQLDLPTHCWYRYRELESDMCSPVNWSSCGQVGLLSLGDSAPIGQRNAQMVGQGYANDHSYGGLQLGGYANSGDSGMIGQLPMGMSDYSSNPAPVIGGGGAMIGQASTSGQFAPGGFAGLIGQAPVTGRGGEPPQAVPGPNYSHSRIGEHAPIGQTDLSDWRRRQALINQSALFGAGGLLSNGSVGPGPPPPPQPNRPLYPTGIGQTMPQHQGMQHTLPPGANYSPYLAQQLHWGVGSGHIGGGQIGQLHQSDIGQLASLQGDYSSMGRPGDIGSLDSDIQSLSINTRRTGGKGMQVSGSGNLGPGGVSGRDSPSRKNSGDLGGGVALDSPGGGRSHSLDSTGLSTYSEASERRDVFPSRSSSLTGQFDRKSLFQGAGQGMVGELLDRRRSSMDIPDAPAYAPELFTSSRRACGESNFGRGSVDIRRGSMDVRRTSIDLQSDRLLVGMLGGSGTSGRSSSGAPRVPPELRRASIDMGGGGSGPGNLGERHAPSLYTTAGPAHGHPPPQRNVAMQPGHGPWGGSPYKVTGRQRLSASQVCVLHSFAAGCGLCFALFPTRTFGISTLTLSHASRSGWTAFRQFEPFPFI